MSLTIRMCAVKRPNIDQLIKGNKRLKSAFHSKKPLRNTHRVALDEKLNKLYDFCGEVPMDDACDY